VLPRRSRRGSDASAEWEQGKDPMSKLKTTFLAGAAGLLLAGGAMAGEPLRLTADQLDQVTGAAKLKIKVQLSWAAATSEAMAAGGSSANISTSNSAGTKDTLNSSTTPSSETISVTATRDAKSATSASATGSSAAPGATAAGGGYSSAGDLTIIKVKYTGSNNNT
jgi:hypothetical protein